jgi:hypothetical protein
LRTLKFVVNRQVIEKARDCDFDGLVKGTNGYLMAKFLFSEDWNGCAKVVGFYSSYGNEYAPQVLDNENSCMIPEEALARETFVIKVFGKRENFTITTNKLAINQTRR